jgi:hypothetical protein
MDLLKGVNGFPAGDAVGLRDPKGNFSDGPETKLATNGLGETTPARMPKWDVPTQIAEMKKIKNVKKMIS